MNKCNRMWQQIKRGHVQGSSGLKNFLIGKWGPEFLVVDSLVV